MKLPFPLNKNTIVLSITGLVTFGFFFGGLFEILDYLIFKILLFFGYAAVLIYGFLQVSKSSEQKNRPEDLPQDDSN
ncbi:hypothetical protein [Winogradskyella ursingii]|uniref:hypothetical protein n=1 Tax=Winogradskyella ursingii TaxID=2686079 RepID=UPI0015CE3806|nr:hypothetical protein [Winogradskyella ursingii]